MTTSKDRNDAAYLRLIQKESVWDQTMTAEFYAAARRLERAGKVVFVARKNGNGHTVQAAAL